MWVLGRWTVFLKIKKYICKMKELEIDILYDTDETKLLEDIGLTVDVDSFDRRKATFYSISAIIPYYTDNKMTKILSEGEIFVVPMGYEDLKLLIRETFQ
jgi:hypothetical protein